MFARALFVLGLLAMAAAFATSSTVGICALAIVAFIAACTSPEAQTSHTAEVSLPEVARSARITHFTLPGQVVPTLPVQFVTNLRKAKSNTLSALETYVARSAASLNPSDGERVSTFS